MARHATRIDRRSLKHDPFFDFTTRATEFVSANLSSVLGITGAIVLAVVLVLFWSRSRAQKAEEGDLRATALVSSYMAGQYAATVDLAGQVLGSYGGTRGGTLALYVKGKSELQLGRFVEAEQSFRAYLEQSSKAPFYKTAAQRGVAASLEGQGRFGEAGDAYRQVAAELTGILADEALLDAARAYRLAGATDQAKGLLQELVDKNVASARQARIELAALEAGGSNTPVWARIDPASLPGAAPAVTPAAADTTLFAPGAANP